MMVCLGAFLNLFGGPLANGEESAGALKVWCEPVDGNIFWNNGQRVFHTIKDSPTSLTFVFHDNQGVTIANDAALVIETPETVSIPEVMGMWYLSSGNMATEVLTPESTPIEREGGKYIRRRVRLKDLLTKPQPPWAKQGPSITVCFEIADGDARGVHPCYYHVENGSGVGAEKPILLKGLPAMAKTANPKRFKGSMFGRVVDINWRSPELLAKALGKYEEANIASRDPAFTTDGAHAARVDGLMRERGWRLSGALYLNPLMVPQSWIGDIKLRHAVGTDGKPFGAGQHSASGESLDRLLCPAYVLHDPDFRAAYKKVTAEHLARVRDGEIIWIDIEPFKSPEAACFCKECLANFSKHSGIATEELADPKVALSKFRKEWVQYQTRVETESIGLDVQLIREILPKSKIGIYDYALPYHKPDEVDSFFAGCRLDPRLLDQHVDMHGLCFYSLHKKRAMELMDINVKTLKKDVWMYPSIARCVGAEAFYTDLDATISPDDFRLKLLAAAASGAKGMVIYPGEYLDGMFFKAIDRAMAEIAELEPFYFDGARRDPDLSVKVVNMSNGEKHVGARVHQLGEKLLLTLINFHAEKTAEISLTYQGDQRSFTVYDPIAKKALVADEGVKWTKDRFNRDFHCRIPPVDAQHLVIRPYQKADEKLERVKASARLGGPGESQGASLRARLQTKETELKVKLAGQKVRKMSLHNLTITPEGAQLLVESPLQKIWIAPKGGARIVKWQMKKTGGFICPNAQQGQHGEKAEDLCWDLFWQPKAWRWKDNGNAEYQVVSASIADEGTAVLTLGVLRKDEEIYLEKTFLIPESKASIEVKYALVNLSENPQTISLWSHNCPKMGLNESVGERLVFQAPTKKGLETLAQGEGEFVFTTPGVTPDQSGFEPEKIRGVVTNGSVVAAVDGQGRSVRADLEFDKLMQFYFFMAKEVATLEWMYKPTTLPPLEEWETRFTLTVSEKQP
ncbi:MAG: hypothetical protein HY360_20710 [Verrucomicrobia bacterium]|nr:hypothetical protein [Verrucomicrobiota bacterium]